MRALVTRSAVSPARDPSRRRELVREWLAKLAANHNRRLDDAGASVILALWVEGFADVPATPDGDAILEAAFRETLMRSEFFPTIASIRSHFQSARAKVFGTRANSMPALPPPDRRDHHCPELTPLAQIVEVFRGVARALPPPKVKEKPTSSAVFRFPADPGHVARVRRQAAEILANVGAQK